MCYFILKQNGQVLSRTMVQHVTQVEQMKDNINWRLEEFDNKVNGCLSDANHIIQHQEENAFFIEDIGELDDDDDLEFQEDSNIPEADEFTPDAYDEYIGAQILLLTADGRIQGRVVKRAKKDDGMPIGRRSDNVLHDTRRYKVELSNGTTQEYYANVIAKNLFAQVDLEGQDYLLMREISDHRKDASAVNKEDGWVTTKSRWRCCRMTTKGWKLLVKWKEGSSDWVPLKDLKELYPFEVAEYAKANKIDDEPAFAWWVNDVLQRRNHIIAKVKS